MAGRRIALLCRDAELAEHLAIRLQSRGDHVIRLTEGSQMLGIMFADPPSLMLMDLSRPDTGSDTLLRDLRDDSYFSAIPIIGLVEGTALEATQWGSMPIDDFVTLPIHYPELFSRLDLAGTRIARVFDNNPLTRLPGNTSIQRAIEQSLGTDVAIAYLDIDRFKPFNDHYGFDRGDEILRMLARILSNAVKEGSPGGFVGHIGGDDFVFIVPLDRMEATCETIIARFTLVVTDCFPAEDRARGHYVARDRQRRTRPIPFPSLSIGVVQANHPSACHAAELIGIATAMKNIAKRSAGSSHVVDRRTTLGAAVPEPLAPALAPGARR